VAAYQALLEDGVDILLGPYGSGTVRHVAPVVCGSGRLLWNHGGAADDLASPLLATAVAPASTYLSGCPSEPRYRSPWTPSGRSGASIAVHKVRTSTTRRRTRQHLLPKGQPKFELDVVGVT